jgi:glycosyltransferase involved in cell wall biosynthesis
VSFEGRFSQALADLGHAPRVLGPVRVSRPFSVRRARARLVEHLHATPVDVVVCHQPWAMVAFGGPVQRLGIPLVLWTHMATEGRHWLERAARAAPPPDAVICSSRFTAASLQSWLGGPPVSVVYCPVSSVPVPTAGARRQVRRDLGAGEETVVITLAARAEPLKGHHVLVDALTHLTGHPRWQCWIVGDAQQPTERAYLAQVRAQVARAGLDGRVRLLGARDDVRRLVAASDIYCQPNTAPEAFGLSCVEALSAGVPVVASALGGALEIVDDTCGCLTPQGNPLAVADTLKRLIDDDDWRRALGAQAPARAAALCDATRQLGVLDTVLRGVVGRSRAGRRAS